MNGNLRFATLDVFTEKPFMGNPLAIVSIPPNCHISDTGLQAIAREFNLSETVFLYLNQHGTTHTDDIIDQDPVIPGWRIRIFMTDRELPFAGHPTIGTAIYALTNLNKNGGSKARLYCTAGTIEINFTSASRIAAISIPHNVHLHTGEKHTVEDIHDMQPGLRGETQLKEINVFSPVAGMNFLYVELPSLEVLAMVRTVAAKPSLKLDAGWNEGMTATLFYVKTGEALVRTRMIAGPLEDPATGSASCGLGALLALKEGVSNVTTLMITQGVEMGRTSVIGVTTTLSDDGKSVESIQLFGTAVEIMEGTLRA
ncbi:hypothetical protein Q7P35_002889 [Cladosporium inversicolor]